jgi:Uma2 family endonuclease
VTVVAQRRLTADEFMAMRDARGYELIDGHLVERKLMGAYADHIAARITSALIVFNNQQPVGWVFGSETTFQCFGSPDTLRRADVSFIRHGRLPGEKPPEGNIRIAPDLAVEVVSPTNTADEVEDKVLDYISAGVELVWVVYPHARTVHVRRKNGPPDVLDETQKLDGDSVLPGFSCAIKNLLPPRNAAATKG